MLGRVRRRTLLPDAGVRGVAAPSLRSSRRPLRYGEAPSAMLRGVLGCGGSGSKHERRSPSNRITTSGMSRRDIMLPDRAWKPPSNHPALHRLLKTRLTVRPTNHGPFLVHEQRARPRL